MKQLGIKCIVAVLLLGAASAWAQGGVVLTPGSGGGSGGCVNSPENPTALLALVGAAGGVFSYARARARSRSRKDR